MEPSCLRECRENGARKCRGGGKESSSSSPVSAVNFKQKIYIKKQTIFMSMCYFLSAMQGIFLHIILD